MQKSVACRLKFLLALTGLAVTSVAALSAPDATPLLLREPTLSRTSIVFSYAGDLWSVPRDGGEARRLTAGPGMERFPRFSPDGSQIAFTGEYDGNPDVFVVPAEGGMPRRLTWHPEVDESIGWTPDGKRVLFLSHRASGTDARQLFTMPLDGSFPEQLPLPIASEASYSPDGSHLAYVPLFQWQQAWKRYRGGQTEKIWIADLSNSSVIEIPRQNSNDFNPMWVGDQIYFLSDRNGPVTLFSYDTRSRQVKQLIENKGYDFKSASAGPGAIVYEQFGSLHVYDLKTAQTKTVEVKLAGDLPELRPHYVNVAKRLENADISPTGARAVFEARGEILTVPAEKGDPRNLTNSPSVHEREPVWSPDGKSIAYFSDESGEYELHICAQDGLGEVKKISLGNTPQFYMAPRWSPDSKKIAYLDNHDGLWYLDLEAKKPLRVDLDYFRSDRNLTPAWSPDSKWLAYAKTLKSGLSAIHLYSLESATITQVTDGTGDAHTPVFDRNGKYLYFIASTNSGPAGEPDLQSAVQPVTSSVYLLVLSRDEKSPLAPESDDEKPADEKKKEETKKDDAKKDDTDKPAEIPDIKVDFENISQRILALPLPARRYDDLQVGKAGVVLVLEMLTPSPDDPPIHTVYRYDLSKRKTDTPYSGLFYFKVSFGGEKVLYAKDGRWTISELPPATDGPSAPDSGKGTLKTEALEVRVDPTAEWKQMYHEVWRIERDFFYDPNYHGLDLKAAEQKYAPFVDGLASRDDLNYLFTEMLGEMTVGHMFINGGDKPDVKKVATGLLGADYKVENGRYRFVRVYNGENWNPDLKAPLTQPGVNVAAGDYLLRVNGRDLRATDNIYSFFEATADKATVLTVGTDPTGAGSRQVTVVPVPNESRLRYLAWIEDNRRKVDQLTGGRVAYIHMPDTSLGGYQSFTRYFYAQVGKDAAIIDERFNHGGHLATDIIEYLQRRLMSVASYRDGADSNQPFGAIFGPKVMIINEFAGSGGDAMPWYFKRAGVGTLVGERTWGGLIGLSGFPDLMDGGSVTAPNAAIWNPNGQFDVENRGITPDIEVQLDPAAVRQGHDPQLERAIQVVMEELQKNPPAQPKRPPYPNYHPK
jgi:tricorn protease